MVRVPVDTLKKHFAWIADQEKIELSDGANELLARAADGSVRDGLSLLDQAIAQTGGHVDEASVLNMLKRADRGVVMDIMETVLSGDTATALEKVDNIYNNGADLSMLLTDMMEWTHWATRMHPSVRGGDVMTAPYTADQRTKIREIDSHVTLNTLSRIWQVMVASVPEMAATGNPKQCFDMLIVRLMHIAEMPSVAEILKKQPSAPVAQPTKPVVTQSAPKTITISSATELASALQSSREILLYTYYTNNIEVSDFADGNIKYFDRGTDSEFAQKLTKWLNEKTGHAWTLVCEEKSENVHTVSEQKREELESDPLIADAMSLFEGAEIIGSTKK